MDTSKRLYGIWASMKQRCYNPNSHVYKYYGGKGITVCNEWKQFDGFKAWALLSGYANDLSIERIDNSKGYSPENCKWIPLSEQNKNRTNSHYITINGETKILADWVRTLNVNGKTLIKRLKDGWAEMDIINGTAFANANIRYPELNKLIYLKFNSKKQMATEMAWNYRLLSQIIGGHKEPTIAEVSDIANALDVPFMKIANIFLNK